MAGGFNPSEKYESQLGLLFPIYGEKKTRSKQPTSHSRFLQFSHDFSHGKRWSFTAEGPSDTAHHALLSWPQNSPPGAGDLTSNNHPSNPQQPIQQPYVKRTSKLKFNSINEVTVRFTLMGSRQLSLSSSKKLSVGYSQRHIDSAAHSVLVCY